jgi:hypothetical protein
MIDILCSPEGGPATANGVSLCRGRLTRVWFTNLSQRLINDTGMLEMAISKDIKLGQEIVNIDAAERIHLGKRKSNWKTDSAQSESDQRCHAMFCRVDQGLRTDLLAVGRSCGNQQTLIIFSYSSAEGTVMGI